MKEIALCYFHNILNYPDDGNHLSLVNTTSYTITKGLDENHFKKKWYAENKFDCKTFKDARSAYLYALRQDQIEYKRKIKLLEKLEMELVNDKSIPW